jgi:hypothetical protein
VSKPEVAFELARDRLSYQLASADSLQSTVGVLYGVSATLIGIMVAILALKPHLPAWVWAPSVTLVVVYVALTILIAWGWRGKKWEFGPKIREYATSQDDEDRALWRVTATLMEVYDDNGGRYRHRVWLLRAAVASLAIETLALLAVAAAAWSAPSPDAVLP